MRWALFVEGSEPSAKPTLAEVWDDICKQLSLQPPCAVFPISKKHLLAMDPINPKMSGAAEGLDALLTRKWQSQSQQGQGVFDAAVILWDLYPAWSKVGTACRWQETLALYQHMQTRKRLPPLFDAWVGSRHQALTTRAVASARIAPVSLAPGAILPLCMVPEFEDWLCQDEASLKVALELTGQRTPRKWPDFSVTAGLRPKKQLSQAIAAVQSVAPLPKVCGRVRGNWHTNQLGWTRYLCKELIRQDANRWSSHPIPRRLREILPHV